ncbi:MAG: hypothetical protein REI78_00905 [Pedobacter sp.]|nr:hypothetical protein [Pedobacter sp.]MDQ8051546.1 hypothetical protein [Pedobacter sp.]
MKVLGKLRLQPFISVLWHSAICLALLFSSAQTLFAEGSKDLYPNTATGNRAFLYANTDVDNYTISFPFKTKGAHFVYAKANESIAVATSALGVRNGQIIVTAPDGTVSTFTSSAGGGLIPNRNAELLGPGAGYTPITIAVTAAKEGVWKVEFLPPSGTSSSSDITPPDIAATANWTQSNSNNSNYIAAWDVSVRNTTNTAYLTGRVYTNVLNLGINNNFTNSNKGFHATNYVLTEDGRAYRVKTNGNNGWAFTFFSNNNGFAVNGVPTYKSLNATTTAALAGLHDPREPDDVLNKTHKIFYGKPNADLPATSAAFISAANQSTWLKKTAVLPVINLLKFTGVEGTDSKISYKGAKISFTASAAGSYQITIPMTNGADRIINGSAVPGYNEIFWDVKDANGNFVPPGQISPYVQTFLRSAEVHFPYIDMEINPRGIIIELTENNTAYNVNPSNTTAAEYSDIVYWDDVDITDAGDPASNSSDPVTNLTGLSSNTNGHKFGAYNGNQFGNERSMDTWTYIESGKTSTLVDIEIFQADLMIESINPDLSKYFSDRTITYTVKVKNDGPSAAEASKLAISLPAGLTISSVTSANPSAGVVLSNGVNTAQGYTATVDLPNQGTIDLIVVATFTGAYTQLFSDVKASIMRPADLSDPDATGNNASGPVDPDQECLNGASSGVGLCNNIKYNTVNGQDVCQASNIAAVNYSLSPDGTQFENSTLPPALSAQDAAGVRTVDGSLSGTGIQQFYLKTVGTNRTQTNVILRSTALPDATASGPSSVCVDDSNNPAISFKGTGASGDYEFSYTLDNGSVQTISTTAGSDTATIAIPVNTTGTFTYKLTSVKDLTTGCSQIKNITVAVTVQPKPTKAHIQLN